MEFLPLDVVMVEPEGVPAHLCDLDHHQPHPHGPAAAANQGPRLPPPPPFAWLATIRDQNHVDWTMPDAHHYRCTDDPLPTGAVT